MRIDYELIPADFQEAQRCAQAGILRQGKIARYVIMAWPVVSCFIFAELVSLLENYPATSVLRVIVLPLAIWVMIYILNLGGAISRLRARMVKPWQLPPRMALRAGKRKIWLL